MTEVEEIVGRPRELFDAVGELALAIFPHNMDQNQRRKVREALHVLVDHIIAVGEARTQHNEEQASLRKEN